LLSYRLGLRDINGLCSSDRLEFSDPDGNRRFAVCQVSDEATTLQFDSNALIQLIPGDYQNPSRGFFLTYELKGNVLLKLRSISI